jgi:uncharacterized protein (DUF305 family)
VKKTTVIAVAALALLSAAAYAQMQHGPSGGMAGSMSMQPKGDSGPSSQAFQAANMKMHGAMDIALSGNTDADFMKGMIPHHQGAIDMARVELQYGNDPWTKELAQKVIDAQTREIAEMTKWLEEHAK